MTWISKPTYHIVNTIVEQRHRITLHEFTMMDCEDPEVYLAEPVYEWQQTEIGKWCMQNATDLQHLHRMDHMTMGYHVAITGTLTDKQITYFLLKKP